MKKVSIILIIVGVLIGISPLIGQIYTRYREDRMISEWLNGEDSQQTESTAAADPEEAYSGLQKEFLSDSKPPDNVSGETTDETSTALLAQPETTKAPSKKASKQTVLGIIQINKINVKAPIVEGVKASNLNAGVGHIPGTAALGQPGNSVLAGHRSYTFGKFFNRLNEIEIGDEIIIKTKKEDLKYKVDKIRVVKPNDLSVLKGNRDENIITLITCTPIYVASHRLIVNASLEERVPDGQ